MGKSGDMVPGKTGPSGGWKKSGAVKYSEMHGSKCLCTERGNNMGSHKRLSVSHGVLTKGKHKELHNSGGALGSSVRTFKNTMGEVAPMHISGMGKKHSKDL
jgi:hypothetical protein